MALAEAILVCLTERPMTGYDLAKTFDTSIGFFWRADHQQIYRELAKLNDSGLVNGREVVQSGKPNKLIYSLTDGGGRALTNWSRRGSAPPTIKDDLLVKLYALEHVDVAALRVQLALRLEHHQDRLARYQRIIEKHFDGPSLSAGATGKLLGLKLGMRYESGWVEWCQDALTTLGDLPGGADILRLPKDTARKAG